MAVQYEDYLKNIPVIPEVASKIMAIAEDKIDLSFKELELMITIDPMLTAKILKVANSSLYSRQKEIKSLQMAITLLGFKNIKSLVMLVTYSNMFSRYQNSGFYQYYWRHSLLTAFISRKLAEKLQMRSVADELFLAGLLHDIGKIALFHYDPTQYETLYQNALEQHCSISSLETQSYETTHREIGHGVLKKWHFPDLFVDTTLEHGTRNIVSSYKRQIIVISTADLLAKYVEIPEMDTLTQENLNFFCRYLDIDPGEIPTLITEYKQALHEDDYMKECQTLFNLDLEEL